MEGRELSNDTRSRQSFEDTFSRGVVRLRGRLAVVAVVTLVVLAGLALLLAWRQYTESKRERDAARSRRARSWPRPSSTPSSPVSSTP